MADQVWPNKPTGPDEFEQREQVERRDRDSLSTEHNEQERIGDSMFNPFDSNRAPTPGSGDGAGGRVRINRDHWGE